MTVKTFISRPLLPLVISVFLVLLGVISLLSLPVERYPDIAPPAIYVWANYPGASAETVHKSVVMPLEKAINGVEGMTYMTSSASNGSASITIYFEQGANADMAAVNVQNRVIQAQVETCHGTSLQNSGTSSLQSRIRTAYDITFNTLLKHYTNMVRWLLGHKWLTVGSVAVTLLLFGILFKVVPTGFIPDEDMGTLFVDLTPPPGYTASKTFDLMNRNCDKIRELPEVQDVGGVVGVGAGANIFIQLKPWKERRGKSHSSSAIMEKIDAILSQETEAQSFVSEPGMVEDYGGNGGFELSVQGRNGQDAKTLHEVTTRFMDKLSERPEIGEVYSSYDVNYPQYRVDLDVARCKKMGVAPSTVLNEMGAYLGGDYISNFNKYNKVYQVDLQLRPSDRNRPESLASLFVRSESGEMMPINQFVTLTKEYMPQSINSFNMFPCIDVSGSVAEGSSSGRAIKAIQETTAKELPVGYSIEFGGITREESQTSGRVIFIFLICIVFAYLVMVALYESIFIPLAVMLSVPFGLAGSLLFAKLFGVENNIYMQIGMVMLVGLLSKTAILLTEYASQARLKGLTITGAALRSAKVRLRPILMTSLTMIIGMLPLMFASGVGANGSRTIGVCVVGGMLFGTLGLLLIVPVLFVVFQKIQERIGKNRSHQ